MAKPVTGGEFYALPAFNLEEASESELDTIFRETKRFDPYGPCRCQLSECHQKIPFDLKELVCKCQKAFCARHFRPEDHSCSYGYRHFGQGSRRRERDLIGSFGNGPGNDYTA